jgi:hypothetical protein
MTFSLAYKESFDMPKMNVYKGYRDRTGRLVVTVNNRGLLGRQDIINHSPDGFECGYCGSGPAQLALAILVNEVGKDLALKHYQDFKRHYVANWDPDGTWQITSAEIMAWLEQESL